MAKMNLNEQEADAVRRQFGDFLTGKPGANNMFASDGDMTMHSDSHSDTHSDTHTDSGEILPLGS